MGILDQIKEIESEIARTQKNKATNYHLGLLRGKLSRLRTRLIMGVDDGKQANINAGFEVNKTGFKYIFLLFLYISSLLSSNKLIEIKLILFIISIYIYIYQN